MSWCEWDNWDVLVVEINHKESDILWQKGVTEEEIRTEKWAVKIWNLLASLQDPVTPLFTRVHVPFNLVTITCFIFIKLNISLKNNTLISLKERTKIKLQICVYILI